MMNEIKIPLSKVKMFFLLLGCAAFVFIGVYILFNVEQMESRRATNPIFMRLVAIICVLFFGMILIFVLKKLMDNKAGLIITEKGIWDNSGPLSTGWILWQDIVQIKSKKVMFSKFILIELKDPEKYMAQASSKFKAKLMRSNLSKYGAAISISSNGLKWNFTRLEDAVINAWKKNQINP